MAKLDPQHFTLIYISDQAMPSQGDHCKFGQDLVSGIPAYDFLARSFVFASGGAGTLVPRVYIKSNWLVSVMDYGSFYSPAIDTPLLNINGTNISVLYQSKADMTNYITSGSLTNYVSTSTNQNVGGRKTFSGGINTKSQTVAGATVLGNDILGGVVRVSGGGNINLPTPVVTQVVEYRFISRLTAR